MGAVLITHVILDDLSAAQPSHHIDIGDRYGSSSNRKVVEHA
jgi:hypothetical protein